MSRHVLNTTLNTRPVEVSAGWDRPLQGFFLTVLYLDTPDDIDYEFAYCNLDTPDPWPFTFDPFEAVLRDMGIELPPAMIEDIRADGRANMGNKVREWTGKAP